MRMEMKDLRVAEQCASGRRAEKKGKRKRGKEEKRKSRETG